MKTHVVRLFLAFLLLGVCPAFAVIPVLMSPFPKVVAALEEWVVSTFSGKGIVEELAYPTDVALDSSGKIYVVDMSAYKIRNITSAGVVTSLAGTGYYGSDDGPGDEATFSDPMGIAIDSSGNIYVADTSNNKIRKITPTGDVSTLAGTGDYGSDEGPGTSASFANPSKVAVDSSGNVYVADTGNHKIRKITPAGVVSTFAGSGASGSTNGTGAAASFAAPVAVAVTSTGTVYVADSGNNKIRKITPEGVVTNFAGSGTVGDANGSGTSATFNEPTGVAVDSSGNVYVADYSNNKIRKITSGGTVSTLAGSGGSGNDDGPGATATFQEPMGVAVDSSGNVYVADLTNAIIRKITPAGVVSTLGSSEVWTPPEPLVDPAGISVDSSGNVYVSDSSNFRIRKYTPAGIVTTLAGSGALGSDDGPGASASFQFVAGSSVDSSGNVYVADVTNQKIRKITPAGAVSTFAGSGDYGSDDGPGATASFAYPAGTAVDSSGNVYVADAENHKIRKITSAGVVSTLAGTGAQGSDDGPGASATFNWPQSVAVDSSGNVYVADSENHKIRKITPAGVVSTLAGSGDNSDDEGLGALASFSYPNGVAVDNSGHVYVADSNNQKVRKITPAGLVSTLAGTGTSGSDDGPGNSATFNWPNGVAVDSSGYVYVSDFENNKVRKITPAGVVTTLDGTGTYLANDGPASSAIFNLVFGVAVGHGDQVYVADWDEHRIRKISPSGFVSHFAGTGSSGGDNGPADAASFAAPAALAVDGSGNLYSFDQGSNLVRKITPSGVVSTLAGTYGVFGSNDGPGASATFGFASGIAVDSSGNVYVADSTNNKIRKITPAGVVSTLAGTGAVGSADGPGASATFNDPRGIAVDSSGNVYVVDTQNHMIRKITSAGVVSTLAGTGLDGSADGPGASASFGWPTGLAIDSSGNLYIADTENNLIRKVTPAGVVSTLAGTGAQSSVDGPAASASFSRPLSLGIDSSGNLYVSDMDSKNIRKITKIAP